MNEYQRKMIQEYKDISRFAIEEFRSLVNSNHMIKKLLTPTGINQQVLLDIHNKVLKEIKYPRYNRIIDGCFIPMIILYNHDLPYQEVIEVYLKNIIQSKDKFSWKYKEIKRINQIDRLPRKV